MEKSRRKKQRVLYIQKDSIEQLLHIFRKKSPKSSDALKKYLYKGRLSLTEEEANLLHKLKKQDLENLDKKIRYLEVKKDIIKLLRKLKY
ncbi:MAG: hypothetical protein ACOC4M_12440 [Promethearchaeia archaeon]